MNTYNNIEPKDGEWWMCNRGGVLTVFLRVDEDWRGDDNDSYSYSDAVPLYRMVKDESANSAALEQPKKEVEWKNGDECVICDDDFSVVVGCEKYIGEAGVVFGSHVNAKGFNLTLVEFKDGGCFAFMTEMLRKPKSERELVIEQAFEVHCMDDLHTAKDVFGKLYDLGMLKLNQEGGL